MLELSRKSDYALRAVIYLTRISTDRYGCVSEIAKAKDIPQAFLAQILPLLANRGVVKSQQGAQGGYALARSPDAISFLDVIESVEGPLRINKCVEGQHDNCSIVDSCEMLHVWNQAQTQMVGFLRGVTMADMLEAPHHQEQGPVSIETDTLAVPSRTWISKGRGGYGDSLTLMHGESAATRVAYDCNSSRSREQECAIRKGASTILGGTMELLKIASVPAASVSPETTVLDAVKLMADQHVGAVAVTRGETLAGIFTERDLMIRVVLEERHSQKTPVSEVMTPQCVSAKKDMELGEALQIMTDRHFRHLPVVDHNNKVLGLLSIRDLLHTRVDRLSQELDSLVAFFTADGIRG